MSIPNTVESGHTVNIRKAIIYCKTTHGFLVANRAIEKVLELGSCLIGYWPKKSEVGLRSLGKTLLVEIDEIDNTVIFTVSDVGAKTEKKEVKKTQSKGSFGQVIDETEALLGYSPEPIRNKPKKKVARKKKAKQEKKQRKDDILDRYKNGESVADIAKRFGVSKPKMVLLIATWTTEDA